ncbi:hypothetical protein [Bradyrhizobium sp. WBOS02]|uniref:hypothetical protein n=1 Tax=Bradyrhizobium sp. WBOS02 TaxID=2171497 RepID=UPI00211F36DC|nr:hypothetical protein [Bradyrhizobium sp. WBOS02]
MRRQHDAEARARDSAGAEFATKGCKYVPVSKERHAGGNKWIGTGGTSPFGSGGFNPEGIRVGDAGKRQGKAAKVWDQREYKNLDDQVELGTRNIKIALRRLRKFAREGAAEELDIDGTIDHTAKDAGLLNIQMRPERRNTVKLLLLLDIGGSMDAHVKVCEELFSACKTEFKPSQRSTPSTRINRPRSSIFRYSTPPSIRTALCLRCARCTQPLVLPSCAPGAPGLRWSSQTWRAGRVGAVRGDRRAGCCRGPRPIPRAIRRAPAAGRRWARRRGRRRRRSRGRRRRRWRPARPPARRAARPRS